MAIKINKFKKPKKVSKASRKRNPKDLLVDQNFYVLIQAVSGINNFFYMDYTNNSNKYDVTNDIPDLEIDLKTLALKVTKVRSESQETNLYGKLPKIGE